MFLSWLALGRRDEMLGDTCGPTHQVNRSPPDRPSVESYCEQAESLGTGGKMRPMEAVQRQYGGSGKWATREGQPRFNWTGEQQLWYTGCQVQC